MDVVKLKDGDEAPVDSDVIHVGRASDGRFRLTASALEGFDEAAQSIAMINGEPYATEADAESAGIAWASDHGVERLYVERGPADDAGTAA